MFVALVGRGHERIETVPLRLERDLRKIVFTGIPGTPEQAKELPDSQ